MIQEKKANVLRPNPMMIYSEDKMERLYRGALRVLRETGYWIDHDILRNMFEQRGLKVDHTRKRVYFTEELINELLSPYPGKGNDIEFSDRLPDEFVIEGSFPSVYDWPARASRYGDTQTAIELMRTFGAMPEVSQAARIVTLTDVPHEIEPIISTAMVIKQSPKPGLGEVYILISGGSDERLTK